MSLDVAAIYHRYGDMVLGRCRALLRNDADAQEAAQSVFLQAHRSRDTFRGDSSPATWLWKVATHTCLNRLRSKGRRPEDPVEDVPAVCEDSLLDRLEIRDLLDRVLTDEDEVTQCCVIYHFMDGMTHDEAGALLGLGGAAVRKRIGAFRERARQRVPDWLEEAS